MVKSKKRIVPGRPPDREKRENDERKMETADAYHHRQDR